MVHSHLKRLDRIWIHNPIYFVTTCTDKRTKILANQKIAEILIEEWKTANEHHDCFMNIQMTMTRVQHEKQSCSASHHNTFFPRYI